EKGQNLRELHLAEHSDQRRLPEDHISSFVWKLKDQSSPPSQRILVAEVSSLSAVCAYAPGTRWATPRTFGRRAASITSPRRSACSIDASGKRCKYRSEVVLIVEWPSISLTSWRLKPALAASEAAVCRKSWTRGGSTPPSVVGRVTPTRRHAG